MKNSRFKFEYRKSASKLHIAVGEILRNSDVFGGYNIYQEYPVSKVNPEYTSNSEHFDWVIPDIKLVIECHGKQHYEVTDFSGKSEDCGINSYKAQKARDEAKKQAAIDAGYTYTVVPYTDQKEVTEDYLWSLYKNNENRGPSTVKASDKLKPYYDREARNEYLSSDKHKKMLDKARQIRQENYRRAKEKRKQNGFKS